VDHVLVEFLRADGSAAEEGETAEIVVTTLNNFAMPLIRYRVGDLGSFSSEQCACGVNLPVMTLQAGKAIDLITTSTRLAVSAHVLDYINLYLMKHGIRGIKQFFVEQTRPDAFVLSIVQETPFDERSVQVFVEKMRDYLGEHIEVETRFVEKIPLPPSGKRRYFKKNFHDP
jgi:phenylacetate-CoA ligase